MSNTSDQTSHLLRQEFNTAAMRATRRILGMRAPRSHEIAAVICEEWSTDSRKRLQQQLASGILEECLEALEALDQEAANATRLRRTAVQNLRVTLETLRDPEP